MWLDSSSSAKGLFLSDLGLGLLVALWRGYRRSWYPDTLFTISSQVENSRQARHKSVSCLTNLGNKRREEPSRLVVRLLVYPNATCIKVVCHQIAAEPGVGAGKFNGKKNRLCCKRDANAGRSCSMIIKADGYGLYDTI